MTSSCPAMGQRSPHKYSNEKHPHDESVEPQVPPLRSRMTKRERRRRVNVGRPNGAPQIPPLRCASVGMTNRRGWLQGENSCRGETPFRIDSIILAPIKKVTASRDDKGKGQRFHGQWLPARGTLSEAPHRLVLRRMVYGMSRKAASMRVAGNHLAQIVVLHGKLQACAGFQLADVRPVKLLPR